MIKRGTPFFSGLRRLALIVRSKWTGQVTSILLHGMLIVFGGILFYEPAEYGIQVSAGSEALRPAELSAEVEIEEEMPLPEPSSVSEVVHSEMLEASDTGPDAEPEVAAAEKPLATPVVDQVPPSPSVIPTVTASPLPVQPVLSGKIFATNQTADKPASRGALAKGTTADGEGNKRSVVNRADGSQLSSKPAYLLSPQPAYPAEARKQKQEGRVRLLVNVDETGGVASLRLKESSGYPILDESALNAVRTWRFYPAKIRGISVESSVEVPVRFRLD